MQLFATAIPPTQAPYRAASAPGHKGARAWPFLVSRPGHEQDMVMAHAKRIIATSKAHFGAR